VCAFLELSGDPGSMPTHRQLTTSGEPNIPWTSRDIAPGIHPKCLEVAAIGSSTIRR